MLEEEFKVKSDRGVVVYGKITRSGKSNSNKAVLMVHGYPSLINSALFEVSKREFAKDNFDVVRFSFFGRQDSQRTLEDFTLSDAANDLCVIRDHIKEIYQDCYLVGHSYGCLVTLISNPEGFNAFTFWDPTWAPNKGSWIEVTEYNEALGAMIISGPIKMLSGVKAYDEALTYSHERCKALAEKIKTPSQIILAEKQPEKMDRSQLYHCINDEVHKELHTITGSSHSFTESDLIERLTNKTVSWFNKL
jgi:pimeloyl-ACP methyl ester carboxylesterase